MVNRSKQKGNRIERELVNMAKAAGHESQRAYASDGRSLGLSEKVDLLVGKYKIQAKGRKKFPKWLTEAFSEVDGVVLKENNKKPVIMIDYEKFLELITHE